MRLHMAFGVRYRSHLRPYARAYAYRGLRAFASLSMARSVGAWLLLMALALANGLAREYWLQPWLGAQAALPMSGLLLALLILLVSLLLVRPLGLDGAQRVWLVGLLWLGLTLGFEFGFGRYGLGHSWEQLLAAYDPSGGNLWLLVLASILCSPWLAARLRGLI